MSHTSTLNMTTYTQGHRPWNTFHSVAGRPCESSESSPSSSYSMETSSMRKSIPWLTRTPVGKHLHPHNRINDDFKFTYARSLPLIADGDVYTDGRIASPPDMDDYLIHFSSSPQEISEVDHDFEDFEDTDSETDIESSDSDSEAQYITIPADSPWWKAPRSSNSPSFDSFIDSDIDDGQCTDDPPSSHSLSLILEKQQFLVDLFHDELRRMMPGDVPYEYNEDWLKEVDAKLLLAPVEAFEETCKGSMTRPSRPVSTDFGYKPVPDVPVDFEDEGEDESIDDWDYPFQAQGVHFFEALPLDPRFNGQQVH